MACRNTKGDALTAAEMAVSLPIRGRIAGTAAAIECAFSAMMTRSAGPSSDGSSVQRSRATCSPSLENQLDAVAPHAARCAPRARADLGAGAAQEHAM